MENGWVFNTEMLEADGRRDYDTGLRRRAGRHAPHPQRRPSQLVVCSELAERIIETARALVHQPRTWARLLGAPDPHGLAWLLGRYCRRCAGSGQRPGWNRFVRAAHVVAAVAARWVPPPPSSADHGVTDLEVLSF